MQNWLKQRRTELHISQDELAARLQLHGHSISRAIVSHWEINRTPIPFTDIVFTQNLADALELTVEEVLLRAGYLDTSDFSEQAYKAAAIVDAMPPERQKTALILLEQLLKES